MKVDGALLASLFCLALVLRLVPLFFSPLPYNIDGFALTAISRDFGTTGHWALNESDPNEADLKLPAFSLVWYAASSVAGLHPLTDIQWFLRIVTATVVLPVYLLGVMLTGRRSVGFVAGLFLAIFGSFLLLTSSVMKESLALLFVPAIVLAFHGRADSRRRTIATVLLLVLAFLHHVTLLMAVGMVGSLIFLAQARALSRGRFSTRTLALDLASGIGPFAVGMAYYKAVNLGTVPTAFDEFVLFLALMIVLMALLARAWRPLARRRGRRFVLPSGRAFLVPAIVLAAVLVNTETVLFPGTSATRPALLELLPPLLFLAALALVGYGVVRRTSNRANDLVLSLAVAPTALVLFGFLRGLDPLSHLIIYRSFDFLDFAFALLVGVGVGLLWARLGTHPGVRIAIVAALLGALLATTPMAWDTQRVFGVDNVTTPEEFQALSVLASLGAKSVASDQRLTTVGTWWFGFEGDRFLPYDLLHGNPVSGADYALVLERWTTIGAQEYPGPNVILDRATLDDFLSGHRIVYVAGVPGDRLYVVQLVDA